MLNDLELVVEQVGVDLVPLGHLSEEIPLALSPLARPVLLDLVQLGLPLLFARAALVNVLGWMLASGKGCVRRTGGSHVTATGEVGQDRFFPGAAALEHEHADPVGVYC